MALAAASIPSDSFELNLPNDKFFPLFMPTRMPVLDTGAGLFDRLTREIIDQDGNPVPSWRVIDPGHLRTRYYVYYGGRGGAKSHQFATALILRCREKRIRALCCREVQSSMADSVHKLLQMKIRSLGLEGDFEILVNAIRCRSTGSEIAFRGLRANLLEIKSFEDADICWVEEAADVTEDSWDVLDPTIRKPGAEIWAGFNTGSEDDPTYKKFIIDRDEDMTVEKVYYFENRMISADMIRLAEKTRKKSPSKYRHIWLGFPKETQAGGIFEPEKMPVVNKIDPGVVWVDGWDLASSEADPQKPDDDPDYTCDVKIGRYPNGRYIVAKVSRMRGTPDKVEAHMKARMKEEGPTVEHSIPQDPGQAGKSQVSYLSRQMAPNRMHFSTETGDKVTRAGGFASQVNVGNVDLLSGEWNDEYRRELASFPFGAHDDQVDASARAFNRLLKPKKAKRMKAKI